MRQLKMVPGAACSPIRTHCQAEAMTPDIWAVPFLLRTPLQMQRQLPWPANAYGWTSILCASHDLALLHGHSHLRKLTGQLRRQRCDAVQVPHVQRDCVNGHLPRAILSGVIKRVT